MSMPQAPEERKPLHISLRHRLDKLRALIDSGYYPYAYSWEVTAHSNEIKNQFSNLQPGEISDGRVSIAGRVLAVRLHGSIGFLDLMDREGKIQVVIKRDVLGDERFKFAKKFVERGDILGVQGRVMRTKKGEISVLAERLEILAKALRDLPDSWYGLEDPDVRFRQRYIDFIINDSARRTVFVKHRILKALREFMDANGFLEVETPVLQPIYGGALARPFETYYWALDKKMYLRVAPELYLKRLIVAMYERVYEVARCFRNEDIDRTHNPEFTQVEFYAAYWDYHRMLDFTKRLVQHIVESVAGGPEIEYNGSTIDFSKPEEWIVPQKLREELGIDVNDYDFEGLRDAVRDLHLEGLDEASSWGELVELLRDQLLEPQTKGRYVYMILYPKDVTPLAKSWRKDPRWAERFEGFVDGLEFVNAYSELNDPIEQYLRFREQEELRKKAVEQGKLSEAHPMDRDYVRALEYALPPTAGCGIGIDRLTMVLAGVGSIREAITFPALRGEEKIETVPDVFPEALELLEKRDEILRKQYGDEDNKQPQ
jgi:lysyl-tRNA synthetase class 2